MDRLRTLVESPALEKFIMAVIVINAITLGLETVPSAVANFGPWLEAIDNAALMIFVAELAAREIPVVAPLSIGQSKTLHQHAGFRFAVFPRRGGRAPELEDRNTLEWIGRFIGRIHAVGAVRSSGKELWDHLRSSRKVRIFQRWRFCERSNWTTYG